MPRLVNRAALTTALRLGWAEAVRLDAADIARGQQSTTINAAIDVGDVAQVMPNHHNAQVIAQFTQLATVFATAPQFTDPQALDALLQITGASADDTALDVACGAGVVACHFAARVARAVGIDITPAMLDKARLRQAQAGLSNVSWDVGDVTSLPYADATFSIVTSRYAIHHMQVPSQVLGEMLRVCRPGGSIAVADICLPDDAQDAQTFNRIERMNDPSHVRALTESEWLSAFAGMQLPPPSISRYRIDLPLRSVLRASHHPIDVCAAVEADLRHAIAAGQLKASARIQDGECLFGYPITVFHMRKPSHALLAS